MKMMWIDDWKYASNRKLKLALKKLNRQLWGILLNPDKLLRARPYCAVTNIQNCPFKFKHQLIGTSNAVVNFCLAPPTHTGMDRSLEGFGARRKPTCFLLPYCRRGHQRKMNEKAWKRRGRIG